MAKGQVFDRAVVIVLDSVGCGAMPDAARFGDAGADTLGHIRDAVGLSVPVMADLGLSRLLAGVGERGEPTGASGRMAERSNGKDTTVGHWEMVGIVSEQAFPTYPEGFPPEVLEPIERAIGRRFLAFGPYSGTDVIRDHGAEHVKTGRPIVYTSGDSVFQVAAHEEVIPPEELWRLCQTARALLDGPHRVGRVIARPFVGTPERGFTRTANRHDYSVPPPAPTLLDRLHGRGDAVVAVGKIADIYDGRGITRALGSKSNVDGIQQTLDLLGARGDEALVFTNLVEFDSLYGHRRDPAGYRDCLQAFDAALPRLVEALGPRDALFITADHGNDPTYRGTDHTREYVPVLAAGPTVRPADLGTLESFADLGATLAENFGVEVAAGRSFLGRIAR
ncbi:MAG: phosphopentomutase [Planctomycetes bacterium]|nr:phosphopentomutase [Planctomycetota bacterium]